MIQTYEGIPNREHERIMPGECTTYKMAECEKLRLFGSPMPNLAKYEQLCKQGKKMQYKQDYNRSDEDIQGLDTCIMQKRLERAKESDLRLSKVIGQKFGRLTILEIAGTIGNNLNTFVKCQCDCGSVRNFRFNNLQTGGTKSCGCSRRKPKRKVKKA